MRTISAPNTRMPHPEQTGGPQPAGCSQIAVGNEGWDTTKARSATIRCLILAEPGWAYSVSRSDYPYLNFYFLVILNTRKRERERPKEVNPITRATGACARTASPSTYE
jgi:hypothetical protein